MQRCKVAVELMFLGGTGPRGAAPASGATEVKIHGEYLPLRADVVKMGSMSAHADYGAIPERLRDLRPRSSWCSASA